MPDSISTYLVADPSTILLKTCLAYTGIIIWKVKIIFLTIASKAKNV